MLLLVINNPRMMMKNLEMSLTEGKLVFSTNQGNVFRFELGLEKADPKRALQSAFTIALSYVIGGLVPLLPYMFVSTAQNAMLISVGVTLAALLFFGYIKGRFTGNRPFISAVQTPIIGALASAAAYGMAKAVQAR